MAIRTLQTSFNGGELTPEFAGKADDARYRSSVATLRNMIPLPHGPAAKRPGTQFVRAVKAPDRATRLIPFAFSPTQQVVIEVGRYYFRFHVDGGTVLASGAPYEVSHPYEDADLTDLHYVQSADVLTLVHTKYPPAELRRLGATDWQYAEINFMNFPPAPYGISVTPHLPSGVSSDHTDRYVVTTTDDSLIEGLASDPVTCAGSWATGAYNTLTLPLVGETYLIYKQSSGVFGYIGQTTTGTFTDDQIAPDIARTPPMFDSPFSGAGNYPGAVGYYEQRRVFGGTLNKPQNLWMTKVGTESILAYSLPTLDSDRIAIRVAATELNQILHILPLQALMLLTNAAEWRVASVNSDAITPSSISVKPQSYIGANQVQPLLINNALVFAAARGGHVRELGYNWQANGYITGDLSLRAPHLFDGLDIVDAVYQKSPTPICWFVSSNGRLLSLTYIPEQQVGAWAWHDTDGVFESVCVVSEGAEDRLYAVVRRTVNGSAVRYVERMAPRLFNGFSDAVFADASLTYTGAPATTISGLVHLEGKDVVILADGAVHPPRVVSGGAVTLDEPASVVTVGLPFVADIQTLPAYLQIDNGGGDGRPKNVVRVHARVSRSSGIFAGPTFARLTEFKQRTTESMGSAPALRTGSIEIPLAPAWGKDGAVCIRSDQPLPLTLLSLAIEFEVAGG